jgi:hypothetical protein
MDELPYDWDELIRRLEASGCKVTRSPIDIRGNGQIVENFDVTYRNQSEPLQVPPRAGNPTPTVVRSLCNRLGLPTAGFDLPDFSRRR